jgi:hypothetical protein
LIVFLLNLMKKTLLILTAVLALGFSKTAVSQWIYGAVSAGMNLTQVDGDEEIGYTKFGFNGGPSVIMPLGKKKNWSVTMELLFSMKGSRQKSEYTPRYDTVPIVDTVNYYDGYKLDLNYVEIPLMVHYTDKKVIAAGAGFSYGQRVGYKEQEDRNDAFHYPPDGWQTMDSATTYTNFDLSVIADVRIRVWKRLWLNGRFSYSMLPIRTRVYSVPATPTDLVWTRKQYNNVITLRLTYIFNEPLPVRKKN